MMRRTPMKRTGFQRPARPPRTALLALAVRGATRAVMAADLSADLPLVVAKDPAPLRDPAYRALVASLPCMHCGLGLHSQCAHENAGKAKGKKLDDRRSMPLCTVSGRDCHGAFDGYRLVPGGRDAHVELGRRLVALTHDALRQIAKHDASAATIVERTIGL